MSQITTHVLDTARGCPATGLPLALSRLEKDEWETLAAAVTDEDGRAPGLADGERLPAGTYRIHFDTAAYFGSGDAFYPWVDVVFRLDDSAAHYHVPLLLSPFAYSTYRGS